MAEKIPYLKVFLSSPGDVNEERKIAIEVIEGLPYRPALRDRVAFRVIAWDRVGGDTPMLASLTPQEAINQGLPRPSECDITLSIFWQRMGTPFIDTDGVGYESGTHWELLDALQNPRCQTLIFRRTEEVLFKVDDLKGQEQYRRVRTFFQSNLFYEGERILRGVNVYEKPEDFRQKLSTYLEAVTLKILKEIEGRIEEPPPPPSRNITVIQPKVWDSTRSPFPGLRAFGEADADIFFGRGRETDELVQLVKNNRFVGVVGASGSGKSSLVGAGLIPRLRQNAIAGEATGSKDWHYIHLKPDVNPFAGLYEGLITTFPHLKPNALEARRIRENFLADMTEAPATLLEICAAGLADAPQWAEVLLFIDQFEELFTLTAENLREPFAQMLTAIAGSDRVRAVVTMRHDFYPKAIELPALASLLNTSLNLPAPKRDVLREMIERPAERAELRLEAGLVERILDDTGDEPGNLALMAYALDELYKLDDDRLLTHAEYEQLGGVQGAIGTRAENEFKALRADESTLQQVFHALVEVDERGIATRRRADFQPETVPTAVRDLIYGFTDARLLTTSYDPNTKTATVEVAHEAILREWKRLADWIEATQDDHRTISRMKRDARLWIDKGRPDFMRPNAETLKEFTAACGRLGASYNDPILVEFTEPEQTRLLEELEALPHTPAVETRRRDIGDRLAVIGDPRAGVGVKDGVPDLVWLPVAGSQESVAFQDDDGKTYGTFKVDRFCIAKFQITCAQYQAFVEADDGFNNLDWWRDFPESYQRQKLAEQRTKSWTNPRDSLSWYQVVAFSRWVTHRLTGLVVPHPDGDLVVGENAEIRLPLEWEWQWAAQNGMEKRKYPWGDWQKGFANTSESGLSRAVAVGMYPHGVAACGALDMSGNLWEWCLNDYRDNTINTSANNKVLRGGAFTDYMLSAASAYRPNYPPHYDFIHFGFRLVCSSPMPFL